MSGASWLSGMIWLMRGWVTWTGPRPFDRVRRLTSTKHFIEAKGQRHQLGDAPHTVGGARPRLHAQVTPSLALSNETVFCLRISKLRTDYRSIEGFIHLELSIAVYPAKRLFAGPFTEPKGCFIVAFWINIQDSDVLSAVKPLFPFVLDQIA